MSEPVRYVSTRGAARTMGFAEVLLAGLAEDGGLYLPDRFPALGVNLAGKSYAAVAKSVMAGFVGNALGAAEFESCVDAAYAGFSHAAVAPLRQIDERVWLLELFHGPTLAFKDVALQLLGQLYRQVLARQGRRVTIVGATSGDTGSAAIEAFRGSPHADVFIMLPLGRVSEVQRRQMTTVDEPNVHVIGIEGSFDDCQDLVKALFADQPFRDRVSLSAVNSINWARIMAQTVYYVTAALALGAGQGRRVAFSVPTGNFGNAYAGHAARRMGLPVEAIGIASNSNDVLTRAVETGWIELRGVVETLSPAMDIQVSSNFERYLFELYEGRGEELGRDMRRLRQDGSLQLSPERFATLREQFHAGRVSDMDTLRTLGEVRHQTGMLIDPHTAIAVHAGRKMHLADDVAIVALASAHPAKFPEAVLEATGIRPELPPNLVDLLHRRERITNLPADTARIQQFITERLTS